MPAKIVVVGSLNADFVVRAPRFPAPGETVIGTDFSIYCGGKGANQAHGVARLGGQAAMVGQVGNDTHAAWLQQQLSAAGVNVSQIHTDPAVSSGIAFIDGDDTGQNQITVIPGANATLTPDRLRLSPENLAGAPIVLLQLEVPLETVIAAAQRAKQAGAKVILDPSPAQALPMELLQTVDYITPNETELTLLTRNSGRDTLSRDEAGILARKLQAMGSGNVIVKMGSQGALWVGKDEQFWPGFAVAAVDTTAAGDAFNAGFAFALAEGMSVDEAGRFANAVAACSVTRPGAQPGMPTLEEVEGILQNRSMP